VCWFETTGRILDYLTLKMMTLHSFEMSGTAHTTTRRDISEDLDLQQQRCEGLRFRMTEA
jgi:hypothetical protein